MFIPLLCQVILRYLRKTLKTTNRIRKAEALRKLKLTMMMTQMMCAFAFIYKESINHQSSQKIMKSLS